MNNIYLNTILYGTAGTGKTYSTVIYAVAIVENKSIEEVSKLEYSDILNKFSKYKSENLIESVTFHQSYGYEEFIEGIKPNLNKDDISYILHDGVFKKFCKSQIDWDFLIGQDVSCKNAKHYRYIIDNISNENINIKKFKLGTGEDGKIIPLPIQIILNLVKSIKNNEITIQDLKNSFNNSSTSFEYDISIIKSYKDILANIVEKILLNQNKSHQKNRVFIIDEINRGNISNIFGELITLIETSKRLGNLEELKIKLPYSQELFGISKNIYILGTMNSSDRSTISIDTALRRRFHFIEMSPNYELFKDIQIDGIDIYYMFKKINQRIEYLASKEYLIGHTYFLDLIKSPTLETLSQIFKFTIIPLLREYFYDDYQKVRLILADNQTNVKDNQFILEVSPPCDLFGNADIDLNPIYEVNQNAFDNAESYRKI